VARIENPSTASPQALAAAGGAPILDYAGPVSRSSLRLTARSELHVLAEPRRLVVNERLAGRAGAVLALIFAAFVMLPLTAVEMDMWPKWKKYMEQMAIVSGFMAAEVVIGAMVVNQTWRRTVLDVTPTDLSLMFASPFASTQRFRWAAEQVARIEVIDTAPLVPTGGGGVRRAGPPMPELELTMWSGPPVRLFTGHAYPELIRLAELIRQLQPPLPQ
jgi:hypothetical protein